MVGRQGGYTGRQGCMCTSTEGVGVLGMWEVCVLLVGCMCMSTEGVGGWVDGEGGWHALCMLYTHTLLHTPNTLPCTHQYLHGGQCQ